MNTTVIVFGGNLTADPVLTTFNDGGMICEFTIANNQYYRDAKDELVQTTSFMDVKLRGKTAENAAIHLKRGSEAQVSGLVATETWTDKETGKTRSSNHIKGKTVDYGRKPKTAQEAEQPSESRNSRRAETTRRAEPARAAAPAKNYQVRSARRPVGK